MQKTAQPGDRTAEPATLIPWTVSVTPNSGDPFTVSILAPRGADAAQVALRRYGGTVSATCTIREWIQGVDL